jgi:hypothetical protein
MQPGRTNGPGDGCAEDGVAIVQKAVVIGGGAIAAEVGAEQGGPVFSSGLSLDIGGVAGTDFLDQGEQSGVVNASIAQKGGLHSNLGANELLPEPFPFGKGKFRLAANAFGLGEVAGKREQHADGKSIAVAGDEGASFGDQLREYGLCIADLRMRRDDDRNVFERNTSRFVARFNDQLAMFDAEPRGLFGNVDNPIAHRSGLV